MEYLGYFGLISFIIVLGLSSRIDKLEKRINGLKRKEAKEKEEREKMSRLIEELQGKWCNMESDDLDEEKVQVCDVDGEWVKVMYKVAATKKESEKMVYKLIRVDSIESVEILPEEV